MFLNEILAYQAHHPKMYDHNYNTINSIADDKLLHGDNKLRNHKNQIENREITETPKLKE
jgi:hypothetical protein